MRAAMSHVKMRVFPFGECRDSEQLAASMLWLTSCVLEGLHKTSQGAKYPCISVWKYM